MHIWHIRIFDEQEYTKVAEFTPMMQKYLETKKEYPDCILFTDWEISTKCFLKMP